MTMLNNNPSPRESLKSYTYQSALQSSNGVVSVDLEEHPVTTQRIVSHAPIYSDEIQPGSIGVTVETRKPGASHIAATYTPEATRELYEAVFDRAKWFMRVHVSNANTDHMYYFSETTCQYNVYPQPNRIPGVIRGPDITQNHTPDGFDFSSIVDPDEYFVPIHLVPDQYWERCDLCRNCRLPIQHTDDYGPPAAPTAFADREPYPCPACGTNTYGFTNRVTGTVLEHETHSGNSLSHSNGDSCDVLTGIDEIEFYDWLLDIEPGATARIPDDFPTDPVTLSDGTVVDWLSPVEPVTEFTGDTVLAVTPFITVTPPEQDTPFAVHQADIQHLSKALNEQ